MTSVQTGLASKSQGRTTEEQKEQIKDLPSHSVYAAMFPKHDDDVDDDEDDDDNDSNP